MDGHEEALRRAKALMAHYMASSQHSQYSPGGHLPQPIPAQLYPPQVINTHFVNPQAIDPWASQQAPVYHQSIIDTRLTPVWHGQQSGNTNTSDHPASYESLAYEWQRGNMHLKDWDAQDRENFQKGVDERLYQRRQLHASFMAELKKLEDRNTTASRETHRLRLRILEDMLIELTKERDQTLEEIWQADEAEKAEIQRWQEYNLFGSEPRIKTEQT